MTRKSKRNTRTLILIVIILLIASVILGFLWNFLNEDTWCCYSDQIHIPESLAYCQYGTIEAYAAATEETLNANSIKIKQLLDSNGQPVAGFDIISSAFPLKRFQQAKKIVSFNCGSACSGTYTMVIATSYVRLQRTVTCA